MGVERSCLDSPLMLAAQYCSTCSSGGCRIRRFCLTQLSRFQPICARFGSCYAVFREAGVHMQVLKGFGHTGVCTK